MLWVNLSISILLTIAWVLYFVNVRIARKNAKEEYFKAYAAHKEADKLLKIYDEHISQCAKMLSKARTHLDNVKKFACETVRGCPDSEFFIYEGKVFRPSAIETFVCTDNKTLELTVEFIEDTTYSGKEE